MIGLTVDDAVAAPEVTTPPDIVDELMTTLDGVDEVVAVVDTTMVEDVVAEVK